MIDENIRRIARDRVNIEIEEQKAAMQRQIGQTVSQMAAKGMMGSSALIQLIAEICTEAISIRAQMTWQIYFRFITTGGVVYSADLADELKNLVAEPMPEGIEDIATPAGRTLRTMGLPNALDGFHIELARARTSALAKVGTEIDLFVYQLRNKEQANDGAAKAPTFNIYSPVGAIQTGSYAVSHVHQQIDADVKGRLLNALDRISEQLDQQDVNLPQPKHEIVELIQESRNELAKNGPNLSKVRSLLGTIGATIQTVASLQGAYDLLKKALVFIGMSLP